MKNILQYVCVGLICLSSCSSNKAYPAKSTIDNSNFEQEIINLDQDRIKALENGDTTWLSKFYADDFIMITSTGEIRNKQDQLKDIGSGKVVHEKIEEKYIRMRFYGNVAIVQSESKGKLIQNGMVSDDMRRFTRVFVKTNKQWQLVSTHISRVATQNK
jgi:ketosteroid isomerase-like protein